MVWMMLPWGKAWGRPADACWCSAPAAEGGSHLLSCPSTGISWLPAPGQSPCQRLWRPVASDECKSTSSDNSDKQKYARIYSIPRTWTNARIFEYFKKTIEICVLPARLCPTQTSSGLRIIIRCCSIISKIQGLSKCLSSLSIYTFSAANWQIFAAKSCRLSSCFQTTGLMHEQLVLRCICCGLSICDLCKSCISSTVVSSTLKTKLSGEEVSEAVNLSVSARTRSDAFAELVWVDDPGIYMSCPLSIFCAC